MAALTQNDLKGYIIGNNQFNFQDARVDDLISAINETETILMRTRGKQGIEVRDNRLILTYGGYYETGAVCQENGLEEVLEPWYDEVPEGEPETQTEPNLSGSWDVGAELIDVPSADWASSGNTCQLWVSGTYSYIDREDTIDEPFEVDVEGVFDGSTFTVNGSRWNWEEPNDNMNFSVFLEYDSREDEWHAGINYSFMTADNKPSITINEFAIYTPDSDPMTWPANLVDIDGIYEAIVDKLINDGYIQAQS